MKSRLLFIHTLSSLHPGTGQSVGAIDLAIAREKSTGVPFLPGSSIKGVLRDTASDILQNGMLKKVFGPPPEQGDEHSGSVSFGDARVLFLPIRSLVGTFAYVTSPFLLQRAARDLQGANIQGNFPTNGPANVNRCYTTDNSMLELRNKVIFEEMDFTLEKRPEVEAIAKILGPKIFGEGGERQLGQRLCIVHDDVMSFFFEQGTEVRARIRLQEATKVVAKGALWYEESLPAETLLLSFITAFPPKHVGLTAQEVFKQIAELIKTPLQFGGNATVGQGLCSLKIAGGTQ